MRITEKYLKELLATLGEVSENATSAEQAEQLGETRYLTLHKSGGYYNIFYLGVNGGGTLYRFDSAVYRSAKDMKTYMDAFIAGYSMCKRKSEKVN